MNRTLPSLHKVSLKITPTVTFSKFYLFFKVEMGWSESVARTLAMMDTEKINFELIEHILSFIVEGGNRDLVLPQEGSILVFLPGKYIGRTLSFHRRDPYISSYLVNILKEPSPSIGGIHTCLPTW